MFIEKYPMYVNCENEKCMYNINYKCQKTHIDINENLKCNDFKEQKSNVYKN